VRCVQCIEAEAVAAIETEPETVCYCAACSDLLNFDLLTRLKNIAVELGIVLNSHGMALSADLVEAVAPFLDAEEELLERWVGRAGCKGPYVVQSEAE
jgi:hypothetical protein